ncbi:MAG TPA: histidine--tRNA ligase [Gemmatimonadales bacterium]|jgi:histidyl-tRNA synthetase|nr:histidine--tRNA ligase [Gemmatimonadales bacterium]
MQTQALPGFRDFYPAELAFRSHIFATWREVARRYAFEEYDGPPLEPLELYTAKSGDEIVSQLYHFTDKGDRPVALRPEMTPTLARMVAARARGLRKPIRWFAIPQLFRYERQQRGRLREHFQFNCDLIGEAGPLADAEVIALAIDTVRAFGLGPGDVRVRLSDRRVVGAVLRARGVPESGLGAAYQFIDKVERLRRDELGRVLPDPGAIAPASVADLEAVSRIKGWEALEAELERSDAARSAAEPLRATCEALAAMGLGGFVDVDLAIVRGLAYYTGTVFELFDARGELRAICGGGRYDTLLAALGGVDLPAVGFGMGDVVLGELLKDRGLAPSAPAAVEVFVAGITPDDLPLVLETAHQLREARLRVEFALGAQAVGKQLKLADARQARLAVVIGPDERARGEVVIKDLRGQGQRTVRRERLVEEVRRGLDG